MIGAYGILLILGLGVGGAYRAWRLKVDSYPLLWGLMVGIPLFAVLWGIFSPESINPPGLIATIVVYSRLMQLWLTPAEPLPLSASEQEQLLSCFPPRLYHVQHFDRQCGQIDCVGELRTDNHRLAHQQIKNNLQSAFPDRFHLVLRGSFLDQPRFYLLPAAPRAGESLPELALFLAAWSGVLLLPQQSWDYGLALFAILGCREWTRYRVAQHFQLSLGPPLLIPADLSFPIGGCMRPLRTLVPDRKALFFLGMLPAVAGMVVSGILWGTGALITPPIDRVAALPPQGLWDSVGATLLRHQFGNLPPWAEAGWHGLLLTSLGLLPIGSLEGGHLLHTLVGSFWATLTGRLFRLALLALSLSRYPTLLIPALLLFLLDVQRQPAQLDSEELPEAWDMIALGALGFGLLMLFPVVK